MILSDVPFLHRIFWISISSSSQVSVDFTERLAPRRRAIMIHLFLLLCPFKVRLRKGDGNETFVSKSSVWIVFKEEEDERRTTESIIAKCDYE